MFGILIVKHRVVYYYNVSFVNNNPGASFILKGEGNHY